MHKPFFFFSSSGSQITQNSSNINGNQFISIWKELVFTCEHAGFMGRLSEHNHDSIGRLEGRHVCLYHVK